MFTVLLICGGLVGFYLLLCATVFKLPKCKSTAKLHGKTVVVTGMCSVLGRFFLKQSTHVLIFVVGLIICSFKDFVDFKHILVVLHNALLTTLATSSY